jgi:hypothetical protein
VLEVMEVNRNAENELFDPTWQDKITEQTEYYLRHPDSSTRYSLTCMIFPMGRCFPDNRTTFTNEPGLLNIALCSTASACLGHGRGSTIILAEF